MSADLVARLRDAYYGEMPVYQEPLHLEAADEIERLLALHRASYTVCPRMPQCWEAANLSVKEASSSRPPDVASGPASPQVKP